VVLFDIVRVLIMVTVEVTDTGGSVITDIGVIIFMTQPTS